MIKDDEYYWALIDNKKMEIDHFPCEKWKKSYENVEIYV